MPNFSFSMGKTTRGVEQGLQLDISVLDKR